MLLELQSCMGSVINDVITSWFIFDSLSTEYFRVHILYSSPNIIRQINSSRMRSEGHVLGEESVQGFDGKARRKGTT
jgi:hypothetical protein